MIADDADPPLSWWHRFRMGRPEVRMMTVDANDGVIATAGIVEGFSGAGATLVTLIVAAVSTMIAGTIALGGAKYVEAAGERDAEEALMEEERRQLGLSPDEELAELTDYYLQRGLTQQLAEQVAAELTEHDALAAHLETEHGLRHSSLTRPLFVAVVAGIAFAVGSGIPLLTILLAPSGDRALFTFLVVIVALTVTSTIAAVSDHVSVLRSVLRTVAIGVVTMLITLGVGYLIAF